LGGCRFPGASGIFFGPAGQAEAPAPPLPRSGTLYALDLAGSCVGAPCVCYH